MGRLGHLCRYCAEKLHRQNSCCKRIESFIQTNRLRQDLPVCYCSAEVSLSNPTNSSFIISKEISRLFEEIFAEGYHYKKAGIIVSDFVDEKERATSLFEADVQDKHLPIMCAMDKMNAKYGKDKIHLGATSGQNIYGRAKMSEEYEKLLKNNTLKQS